MIRLFQQHRIRKIQELEGLWDFTMEGFAKQYRLPVPGCWEQHPDFLAHRGRGTYTQTVTLDAPTPLRLDFKGVSHTAEVYFDGKKIARHYNAFTPFSVIIPEAPAGVHELKVVVDNTFGEHSALHVPNDYYTYGGITRPVALEQIASTYIKQMHITPYQKDGIWQAQIEVRLENLTDNAVHASLTVALAEEQLHTACTLAAKTESTVILDAAFPQAKAWSMAAPNLYLAAATLSIDGVAVDDLIERIGFRTISVRGKEILLNGEPVFLKGFNRHEDYATVGCAVPLQLMVQDMDLMQDLGANAVRTCHYPNDERFLDLCDERGILVWEENHARGLSLERMQNPNFDWQCKDCIDEMVQNHYNHPSIFVWGILNECASETEEGAAKYKAQFDQIKNLDTSRPTTSATCKHFKDKTLAEPDVVSFNLYAGWYEDVSIKERKDKEVEWIYQAGGADKPIIVSEFGAGAIYGYRDRSMCKWSEERQAQLLGDSLQVYMNDSNICGVFIWLFADCRVTEEEWWAARARCHNNKGVVDEYRRPKLSYDVVKEWFHKK